VVTSAFTAGVPASICGGAVRSHKSRDAAKKKKRTSLVAQWIRILLLMHCVGRRILNCWSTREIPGKFRNFICKKAYRRLL